MSGLSPVNMTIAHSRDSMMRGKSIPVQANLSDNFNEMADKYYHKWTGTLYNLEMCFGHFAQL